MRTYEGNVTMVLQVNGEEREVVVRPADTLLRVIREKIGLRGTKIGCENGDCGACTVHINGVAAKSCMVLAVEVEGDEITTIEGMTNEVLKEAFIAEGGFQCGYCTSGFLMNAAALLSAEPKPDGITDDELRVRLESNLCRCTGYEGIERAVKRAARGG
ncbi:MAG TPA: (2Fe-2S)-binding protein [Spirochaetia bacterium]|nr:(2Fe-2S)-binding protein [Spirochaetia bacterium]